MAVISPFFQKTILSVIAFVFILSHSYAQTFMVLEKMGTKKRYTYYIGENIEYQLKGEKLFNQDQIIGILDSAIVIHNDSIPFKAIEKINIKPKRKLSLVTTAGPILVIAGLGYFAIDQINRGVVQGGNSSWDSSVATTSAIIAGSGALIMILHKNKVPISGWWRLRKVSVY